MGPICLGANESHIYPNMCAIFHCSPMVVSREKVVQQTRQVSRITREGHGFWQFIKAHGRVTQCSRIYVNLTERCDQGILFFCATRIVY